MIYELRTELTYPAKIKELLSLAGNVGVKVRGRQGRLVGYWRTIWEPVEVVHLWEYDDFEHFGRAQAALAADEAWSREYLAPRQSMVRDERINVLLAADVWPFTRPAKAGIYELRDYLLHPGKLAEWLAAWKEGMTARRAYSGPVGVWYSELGQLNRVVHLWPYDSLEHRFDVRRNALDSEVWRNAVARLATLMQVMESKILIPTGFSPIK